MLGGCPLRFLCISQTSRGCPHRLGFAGESERSELANAKLIGKRGVSIPSVEERIINHRDGRRIAGSIRGVLVLSKQTSHDAGPSKHRLDLMTHRLGADDLARGVALDT